MIGRLLVGGLLDRLCGPCSRPRRLARRCAGGRDQSKLLDLGVLRRTHQLTDGLLVDTEPLRNRSVAQPMALECLNAAQPLSSDTPSATTPTRFSSQPHHPCLRVAHLVPAHRALRFSERARNLRPVLSTNTIVPENLPEDLAALGDRYRELVSQLTEIGFFTAGSLLQRRTVCGTPSCPCHADAAQRH